MYAHHSAHADSSSVTGTDNVDRNRDRLFRA